MRPPKLAKLLLKVLAWRRDRAYLGDVEEIYLLRAERLGLASANRWYRREALRSLHRFIFESLRWRIVMLKNYLKTAVRFFCPLMRSGITITASAIKQSGRSFITSRSMLCMTTRFGQPTNE